jgi:hypothetical protein
MLAAGTLAAQPVQRDHRAPAPAPGHHTASDFRDHRNLGRTPVAGPTMAPPPPREEKWTPKAGFVWIPGRYEWRVNAYAWIPGHMEREHAGHHWNPGRWENRGGTWAWVEGSWVAGAETPPPGAPVANDGRPHMAPPPPREEHWNQRPGFVWVAGHYEWRNNAYAWIPGHEERVRANQHWNPGHWDNQNGAWVWTEGSWIAGAMPPPGAPPPGSMPPPGAPPPGMMPHHEWHLDRPVVSDYWPVKGKVGTRVVISGRNFPPDLGLIWGGKPIQAEHITAEKVVFRVPHDATTGMLVMHQGHGPDITVGMFEVANYDAAAEEAKREAEWKKHAQDEWAQQQKALAKDRAAREAAFEKRWKDAEETREQRRAQRAAEIRARWDAAFLNDPDTQAELTLHAQRIAELTRMKDLAEIDNNGSLAVRIDTDTERENTRHDERMQSLKAAFAAKGGRP